MNNNLRSHSNDYPFVSVIIPALNEEGNVGRCLKSIFSLAYPSDRFEVVLVDNGSTDKTCTIAATFDVKIVKSAGYIGSVRNAGAQKSKGEILAYLDADCAAPVNWLTAAVEALKRENIGAVGGICLVDQEESNWVERGWVLHPIPKCMNVKHLATGSFLVSKEVFNEVGGFNEQVTSGEDMEISSRIVEAGYTLRLLAQCAVIHYGYPKTLRGILKRQIWHASSYLTTMKNKKNPVFLLSHLYAASLISLVPFIIYNCDWCLVSVGLILLTIPVVATILKFYRNGFRGLFSQLGSAVIIMFVYYFGRSLGLCKSYYKIFFKNA